MPKLIRVSDSFTRPANTTPYSDLDLVANSATAGSVSPLSFNIGESGGFLQGIRLSKSGVTATNATFSVHLYGASPTVANGDNGALSTNVSSKIAEVELAIMVAYTDDAASITWAGGTPLPEKIPLPHGIVYALIEADAAYTPASAEVFTLELTVEK